VSSQTKLDGELRRIINILSAWTGPKTSLWWRLESERVRLLAAGAKAEVTS
jgi:hypothetical protein